MQTGDIGITEEYAGNPAYRALQPLPTWYGDTFFHLLSFTHFTDNITVYIIFYLRRRRDAKQVLGETSKFIPRSPHLWQFTQPRVNRSVKKHKSSGSSELNLWFRTIHGSMAQWRIPGFKRRFTVAGAIPEKCQRQVNPRLEKDPKYVPRNTLTASSQRFPRRCDWGSRRTRMTSVPRIGTNL